MAGSIYAALFGSGTPTAPGAVSLLVKSNSALAWKLNDGTTDIFAVDTRNTVTAVAAITITASPPTIATATGDTFSQVLISAITVTLTSTTLVTALDGLGLWIGVPTVTNAGAGTVTTVSNLYVALPVAAGSAVLTNVYAIHAAGAVKIDGAIDQSSAASTHTIKSNTAASHIISDGTTSIISVDTRTTVNAAAVTITMPPPTIVAASGTTYSQLKIAAGTVTLTGGTGVTAMHGVGLSIGAPTVTDSTGVTVSIVSNLFIAQVAAAGGSVTITNSYMISTGVSDCFLTNAGVWTDHSCFADGKRFIVDATRSAIETVINKLNPKSWLYREEMHGDDFGRERVGIVYDELPDELLAPGHKRAVSAGVLSSFALAAIKMLWERNQELEARLSRLEAAV